MRRCVASSPLLGLVVAAAGNDEQRESARAVETLFGVLEGPQLSAHQRGRGGDLHVMY
jgi:hypothetical protein